MNAVTVASEGIGVHASDLCGIGSIGEIATGLDDGDDATPSEGLQSPVCTWYGSSNPCMTVWITASFETPRHKPKPCGRGCDPCGLVRFHD